LTNSGTSFFGLRAFKARRCLIPAHGFYEWEPTPRGKQPYRITLADGFYEQALREADQGSATPALWAKAFADADGDLNRTKARYIKLRVAELGLLKSNRPSSERPVCKAVELADLGSGGVDW
jgi:hypothetical protein